ncbi:hypothetical protein ACM25N_14545 [Roseovarius sp. C7]|uniref:hypothetical protein n=1 Tax=Roseovarius sp. C7 TaxID=3398643 RepID=UPI0039F6ED99
MNTTPDFDKIGHRVPLEARWKLRALAALRLCVVAVATYACLSQLLRIGLWSATGDRIVILLGLWTGLGLYADGIEIVWRRLECLGRTAIIALGVIILAGTLMAPDSLTWFRAGMVLTMCLLGAMAYGLVHILMEPLRALRFRQMKRYLRTLPAEKRRTVRDRLDSNFQTLVAEGFR